MAGFLLRFSLSKKSSYGWAFSYRYLGLSEQEYARFLRDGDATLMKDA